MVQKRLARGMTLAEIANDMDLSADELSDIVKKHSL
jgi:transcriptional regulator with XRE-family HTH domain